MMKKKRMIITGIFLIALFTIWANVSISRNTEKYISDDISTLPFVKTGLLLGTGKYLKNGSDNPYFFNRIDAAEILYKSGKIKYIIASGDNSQGDYNEPDDMKEELIKRGIPETAVFTDYAGFRTLDSVLRAKEIFGQDSILVISQKFHNERAIFIAQNNKMTAYGFNAKEVSNRVGIKVKIREVFARVKVFIDFLFNVQPKFYGEKIEIK